MNLADALALNARQRPNHPALIDAAGMVQTHAAFNDAVNRYAHALAARGAVPGRTVAVALRDDAEHVAVIYALARLGVLMLPIDFRWTDAERGRMHAAFRPSLTLVDAPRGGEGELVADAAFRAEVAAASAAPPPPTAGDPPLLIALSSGTTGDPKGPVIRHSHMRARFVGHYVSLGFSETHRMLCATPLYHGGGRGFVMSYLHAGATVVLCPPPWDPPALAGRIATLDITAMFLVPTQLRRCLAAAPAECGPGRPWWPGVATLVSTGSALASAERLAIRQRLSPAFRDYYGSTEGGGASVLQPDLMEAHIDTVGRPSYAVEIQIVDPDGRQVPPGTEGSVRWRGPAVPVEDTGAPGMRDGWYYPGDRGRVDAEGFLTLAGRDKALIIRGGVNIDPAEIEGTLRSAPGVEDVAVIGAPSAEYGEEVAAFVVAAPGVSDAALAAHCRERLAYYKVPRVWRFVPALPRNAGGKVVLTRLRAML